MNKKLLIAMTLFVLSSVFTACSTPAAVTTAPYSPADAEPAINISVPPALNKRLEADTTRRWYDIPYADQSPAQKLDIYLPETGDGPFPVIFAIHGGGFFGGDKALSTVAARMQIQGLDRNYAVVQVNYRLSKEESFPAQIYDVKAALRFIKENAAKYSLDSDKIAVWGDSAGGSLAALIGTSAGVEELEDLSMGNEDQSTDAQAVVDLYGIVYFDELGTLEMKYLGTADNAAKASAATYISADDPPFFIEHGTRDAIVSPQQSEDFAAALKKALGEDKVTLTMMDGLGHAASEFEVPENVEKVFTFLDKYLK